MREYDAFVYNELSQLKNIIVIVLCFVVLLYTYIDKRRNLHFTTVLRSPQDYLTMVIY